MFLKQLLLGLGLCSGLAAAADEHQTPLTINNAEYRRLCEEGSPRNHPCFTFLEGDVKNVDVEISREEWGFPVTDLLVKDDAYRDFTIDDPSKAFSIYWMDTRVALIYSPSPNPTDLARGCFKLTIMALDDGNARIWANDGLLGEGIDIDSDSTPDHRDWRQFCTKWIRLHVANDRGQN